MANPYLVLTDVVQLLEDRGIKYVLVGSIASSMYGMSQATEDIDLIADISPAQVRPLLEALRNRFHVDEQAVSKAISQQQSFIAIPFDAPFKVDIFIPKPGDFAMQQIKRRQLKRIAPGSEQKVYVATIEDLIIARMQAFRAGGEAAENHWRDLLGMVGTSDVGLDLVYLRLWAKQLGLTELMENALDDST